MRYHYSFNSSRLPHILLSCLIKPFIAIVIFILSNFPPKKTLFLLLLPLETSLKRGVRTGTNISLDVRALYPFYHTFCFSLVLLFFPMFPVVFRLSKGKFKNFAESSTFVRRSCFLIDQAVIKMAIRMLVPRDLLERFVFGETNAASVAD